MSAVSSETHITVPFDQIPVGATFLSSAGSFSSIVRLTSFPESRTCLPLASFCVRSPFVSIQLCFIAKVNNPNGCFVHPKIKNLRGGAVDVAEYDVFAGVSRLVVYRCVVVEEVVGQKTVGGERYPQGFVVCPEA